MSAEVHFIYFTPNIQCMNKTEKCLLHACITQQFLRITPSLSVGGAHWTTRTNFSMLVGKSLSPRKLLPLVFQPSTQHLLTLVVCPLYRKWQEVTDTTLQHDHHRDNQNLATYTFSRHTQTAELWLPLQCHRMYSVDRKATQLSSWHWSEHYCFDKRSDCIILQYLVNVYTNHSENNVTIWFIKLLVINQRAVM